MSVHSHCAHAASAPPTFEVIDLILAQAASTCEAVGSRLTEPRRRTLRLLLEAGRPVKAYDMLAAFGSAGRQSFPATIYRILEFLQQVGLVHRIETLNAFVACSAPAGLHTAAFWICECCGKTKEDTGLNSDLLDEAAKQYGFQVQGVTAEIRGHCRDCA